MKEETIFKKTTVKDFFETELVDYASYSTLRAIASLVDGQKNSSRKVIHTVQKKNITSKYKVQNLASLVSMETEYLHGGVSLEGVIVTNARNFIGTNNLNVLYPSGNFGTRFEPEASASRYIFTYKEKVFDKLFIKEDNNVLIKQNFEGTDIEPRFFVPTLPLILINGSEGIATGFAQKILPRDIITIKEYIRAYLANEETPELLPYFNGFKGKIKYTQTKNQVEIDGIFNRVGSTKIIISELPIGYNLKQYTKILDDLEDKKIINSFKDLSNSKKDEFLFELKVTSKFSAETDEWIIGKLKLRKTVTENFTVIDENNRVKSYESPEEVINHYIEVKLQYLEKRKQYLIDKTKHDLLVLASKYIFVKNVTDENILVNKKKKEEIIKQIQKFDKISLIDGSYDYLLRMPIYSLTEEKLDELLSQIKSKKQELQDIIDKKTSETWVEEIEEVK
jgi:DNA topoisomerase-2